MSHLDRIIYDAKNYFKNNLMLNHDNNIEVNHNNYDNIIIITTGGSYYIINAITKIYYGNKNIYFLNSINYNNIKSLINKIDINKSIFITITKSGITIELEKINNILCSNISNKNILKNNFYLFTENKNSSMLKFAQDNNYNIIIDNIAICRFGFISKYCRFFMMLLNLNYNIFFTAINEILNNNNNNQLLVDSINYNNNYIDKKYKCKFICSYIDELDGFFDWYIQAWIESLSKKNFPTLAIKNTLPLNQHGMLQFYLGGNNKDIYFDIYNSSESNQDLLFYQDNFIQLLDSHNLNFHVTSVQNIDEYQLGNLMINAYITIFSIAKSLGINPLDQNHIDNYKKHIFLKLNKK